MALLPALESVDWVVRFDEKTPLALIEAVRPNILVEAGEYAMGTLPEWALVRAWGSRASPLRWSYESSTTARLKKMRAHRT